MTTPSFTQEIFEPPEDYAPADAAAAAEVETALTESLTDAHTDTSDSDSANLDAKLGETEVEDTGRRQPAPARKTIKLPRASEQPYVAGQCTVTLTLTLAPGDGPILAGVRSHDSAPLLETLPRNDMPECLQDLLQRHYARLPELAAQAEAEKTQRSRKAKTTAAAKTASQKAPTTPAKKHKPDPKAAESIPQGDLFAELDQRTASQS